MRKLRRPFCAAFFLFSVFLLSHPSSPQTLVEQPVVFQVHPDRTFQTMDGFGAGIHSGLRQLLDLLTPAEREKLYDLAFGSEGLRLNIARLMMSADAAPLPPDHPLRAEGLLYDWAQDEQTRALLEALGPVLERTSPVLYAVPFTPPQRWKSNKQKVRGGVLLPKFYEDYAEYLADFLDYCGKKEGLKIDILSLQNEPDVAAPWNSAHWTGEELKNFLKVAGPALRRRGLETKIMVAEGSTWPQAWLRVAPSLEDDTARQYIGVLASHSYNFGDQVQQGRELMRSASEQYEIPLWMSEMSLIGSPDDPTMKAAIEVAYTMYRDLVEANASAWIYCFVIFTAEFPGSMGVFSPPREGRLVIPKRFWVFANYSRFVRSGWRRVAVEGLGFANAAFVSPQGDRFAIVALNALPNQRPVTYDFRDWEVDSVQAFCTSSEHDLAALENVEPGRHFFRSTLTPISVTTFVGKLRRPDWQ